MPGTLLETYSHDDHINSMPASGDSGDSGAYDGGGNPPARPQGGVLTPAPEPKVERTRTRTHGTDGYGMTDDEKKLPVGAGVEYYDPDNADVKGMGVKEFPEGHPDRGITHPFGEGLHSDADVLEAAHAQDMASLPADERPQPGTPRVQPRPGFIAADPFSNPDQFQVDPQSGQPQYTPATTVK